MLDRACFAIILLAIAATADAQFFAHCRDATMSELRYSARAYEEHSFRLNNKFLDGFYKQDDLPHDFVATGLDQIQQYLAELQPRKAVLLFYAIREDYVCTWMISADDIVAESVLAPGKRLNRWADTLRASLGVTESENKRGPRKRGVAPDPPDSGPVDPGSSDEALFVLSEMLLPGEVRDTLLSRQYDTVLVAPVSSIATLPLAALPVDDDRRLIDVASVVMLPGLFVMKGAPPVQPTLAGPAVIVGDPVSDDAEWLFPPLPGAREEVLAVAEMMSGEALVGEIATPDAVLKQFTNKPDASLIYFATHGIASRHNPRDASFLLLTGGRLPAVDIQNLSLTANPLVVLSACQTGLGKEFEIGTIGMARAWERAGASSVVMSLWNVDDAATRDLMLRFLPLSMTMPADIALQQSMIELRLDYPSVASWAGLAVFGAPQRLPGL